MDVHTHDGARLKGEFGVRNVAVPAKKQQRTTASHEAWLCNACLSPLSRALDPSVSHQSPGTESVMQTDAQDLRNKGTLLSYARVSSSTTCLGR